MLVHHPHARVDRGARGAEPHLLALDQDLALVGVVEPVEDVHQRRLPRAVLAEERMDLAFDEIEADVVVRDDPGEALRDVPHLEDQGSLGHPRDSIARRGRGGPARAGGARARRARDVDVAGRDLLRDAVELRDQRVAVGRVGAHLAVADAAVRDVVERVAPALEASPSSRPRSCRRPRRRPSSSRS